MQKTGADAPSTVSGATSPVVLRNIMQAELHQSDLSQIGSLNFDAVLHVDAPFRSPRQSRSSCVDSVQASKSMMTFERFSSTGTPRSV